MIYEIANNRKFPKKKIYVDAPIVQQRIAEVDNDNLRVKMIYLNMISGKKEKLTYNLSVILYIIHSPSKWGDSFIL